MEFVLFRATEFSLDLEAEGTEGRRTVIYEWRDRGWLHFHLMQGL